MRKVKRFSLEERYGYQNRKVIYDKSADNDIELNNIYSIIDLFNQFDEQISDLQHRLEDAREAGNTAVDYWCKNRRKYEAQIAEMQNKSFILYSMLYETLEKQGCDNVASQIDQMTGWTYDKEANWLKGNRNYDQLKQEQKQLAIEELEKVKEYNHTLSLGGSPYIDVFINNQIKSLK